MARPRKSEFKDASKEVIEKEFLKGPEEDINLSEKVVVANKIPEMTTVEFRNDRDPGVPLEFHYATASHPLKQYRLFHGQEVTLPLEVVEHLESCRVPLYSYRKGFDGNPEMFVNGYKHQFTCKPIRKHAFAA